MTAANMIIRIKYSKEFSAKANAILEASYSDMKKGFGDDVTKNVKIMDENHYKRMDIINKISEINKKIIDKNVDFDDIKNEANSFLEEIGK